MQVGERLSVGQEENPFFAFYRKPRFELVNGPGGTVELVPAMAFLRRVILGNITPSNLPQTAYDIANHFVMLSRELLWEAIRASDYPEAPSRQRALWLLPDLAAVRHWQARLKHPAEKATQVVEVLATGVVHVCDAALLTGDSEALDDTYRKARDYWSGMIAAQGSEPEILFRGELEVVRRVEVVDGG